MKISGNQVKRDLILIISLLYSCSNPQIENTKGGDLPYGDNQESGQFLEQSNAQIYFETYGNRTDPPLVLIHGNGGSIEAMTLQIEFFKDIYFVIVVDNRTHGKSGSADNLTYDINESS